MSDRPQVTVAGSRRAFLKAAAAASAASALTVPKVHAAENNTIRLALIGCGGRGTGAVADAFAATGGPVKLYAMADVFENRLQGSLAQLKRGSADKLDVSPERQFVGFDAYRKAIDQLAPGDVAILTTPAVFRPQHFEYAVGKGVHVFMEKSFAVDGPAVRRLLKSVEVSQQKGLKVGVGFMWRHCKARQEVIQRIHDGAIGDLHTVRIYRVHGPCHCPPVPAGANQLAFQLQHPMSFNWTSGSFFVDWHCHNVDVACWALNAWPVSAQAFGGRTHAEAGNLFDHYTVEYTMPSGAKIFAFSRHMNGCWQTYSDYAHGTKGSAVLMKSLSAAGTRIYKDQNMAKADLVWSFGEVEPNPYHREWQVLLDAIRQDKPHNESRRAAEADMAAIMGRMAAHTGAMITWDEAMNSNFEYVKNIDQMTMDTPAPILADAEGRYAPPVPGVTKEC